MSKWKNIHISTRSMSYKLHYETLESAIGGVCLRQKVSKNAEKCGYQFHSHTAQSTPISHLSRPQSTPLPLRPALRPFPLKLSRSKIALHLALFDLCKRPLNTTAINNLTIFNHKRYRISTEELKRISISRTILSPTGTSINSQESIE